MVDERTKSLREVFETMEGEQRKAYLDHMERVIEAHNDNHEWHARNNAYLAKCRAEALAMPLPRNTCPGCFMAIYDLAAAEGWCGNCNPIRLTSTGVERKAPVSPGEPGPG